MIEAQPGAETPRLRQLPSAQLTAPELAAIRALMNEAFGTGDEAFGDDDWAHALGGKHFVLELDEVIVSHASVVERELHIADRPVRTGYVEAVATTPSRERRGLGTLVMEAATSYIRESFELGALGTGRHHFYERLDWQIWAGPAHVRTPAGLERTADDEGWIMVLKTSTSPSFEGTEPISCEWRPGDVW